MIMSHACLRHQLNNTIKRSKYSYMTNVVLIASLDINGDDHYCLLFHGV